MKKTNGFTLIELLVVIAIIGLISTMTLVVLRGKVLAARDVKRRADIATLQTAIAVYYSDRDIYPPPTVQGGPDDCTLNFINNHNMYLCAVYEESWFLPTLSSYMTPSPPEDPGQHSRPSYDGYRYIPDAYDQTGRYRGYVLFFMLEQEPQEDMCNMGPMNFGDGVVTWSTRCPD